MMTLFRTYRYPLLSGVLLGLSGAQVGPTALTAGLAWLVWVAAIPWLLWLWQKSTNLKHATIGSALMGFVWHAITLHWMLWLHPLNWAGVSSVESIGIALGAWLLWSLLGGGAILFVGIIARQLAQWCHRNNRTTNAYKALWILIIGLLWPWAHIGMAQLTDIYILWADPITPLANWPGIRGLLGTIPLTLLWSMVLVINGALAWAWSRHKAGQHQALAILAGCLVSLCIANPISFFVKPPKNVYASGLQKPWVIYQKNLPISAIRAPEAATPNPSPYLTELQKATYAPGATIVLPEEGIIRGWIRLESPTNNPDYHALQTLAHGRQWTIITGASTLTTQPYSPAARPPTLLYNSLLVISPHKMQAYHKHYRVPFGETMPNGLRVLSKTPLNGWLTQLARTVKFPYIPMFTAGANNQQPLQSNKSLFIHPSICFELALKPFQSRNTNAAPTTWMVNTSNLGWFHGNRALARQFWHKGKLAAAVHHQPLAIAANTGPSGIIDATGNCHFNLPINIDISAGWAIK